MLKPSKPHIILGMQHSKNPKFEKIMEKNDNCALLLNLVPLFSLYRTYVLILYISPAITKN